MDADLRDLAGLDRVIHQPARLLILALLSEAECADFLYLLRQTGLTKGNLGAHLTRLEEAGYVAIDKGYRGKVPQTMCRLTKAGRAALGRYRAQMQHALELLPQ